MNKSKKLLSLLLTLAMVLALLGGSFAFADEAEEPAEPMPFTKTDGFVIGEQVLLVAELEGKSYALASDGSALYAAEVTVEDGEILVGSDELVWKLREGNYDKDNNYLGDILETCAASETYLLAGSGGLMVFGSSMVRNTAYDAEGQHILLHNGIMHKAADSRVGEDDFKDKAS